MRNRFPPYFLLVQCFLQLFVFAHGAGAQSETKSLIGGSASKKTECVRLLNAPVVVVDPMTGSGEARLLLTNQTEKQVNAALLGTVTVPLTQRCLSNSQRTPGQIAAPFIRS